MMKKTTFLIFMLMTISLFSQNKLTSSLNEYFNGTTWINSDKTVFTYDANNNLLEEIEYVYNNSISDWQKNAEYSYVYNANNKVSMYTYKGYIAGTNTTSYHYRSSYSYNSSGNLTQILDEEWNGSTWVNEYKTELIYSNGKIDYGLSYEWVASTWMHTEDAPRTIINYNADGTIASSENDIWNGSAWVSDTRTINTFDANKRITLSDSQTWDGTNWFSDYKEENTYDANGNAIRVQESYLENGSFNVNFDETITFDTTQLMSSFAHPFKDKSGIEYFLSGNGIVNKILTRTSSDYRTTYYYGNESTASVNEFDTITFSVYPNPTSSILKVDDSKFSLKKIEVFNVIGKKILISSKNELNLENLVNGVYLLKIESMNGNIASKRIIKN